MPTASSLSDKIYAAMADITSEFHMDLSRKEEALSGDETAVSAPPKSRTVLSTVNKRATVLSFAKLELYMEKVALPGSETPMGKALVEAVLKRLQRDLVGNITRDNFRHWFETNSTRKDLLQLNESTIFARLLAEDMDAVFAFQVSSSGAAQGTDEWGDVDYSAQEALHANEQTPVIDAADRLEKVKRLQLWDQRQGRVVAKTPAMQSKKSVSTPVGLSDGDNTFRAKYLRYMAQLAADDLEEESDGEESQSGTDNQSPQQLTRSATKSVSVRAQSTVSKSLRGQSTILSPTAFDSRPSRSQSAALYRTVSTANGDEVSQSAGRTRLVSKANQGASVNPNGGMRQFTSFHFFFL
jgi:hypothetical protein